MRQEYSTKCRIARARGRCTDRSWIVNPSEHGAAAVRYAFVVTVPVPVLNATGRTHDYSLSGAEKAVNEVREARRVSVAL